MYSVKAEMLQVKGAQMMNFGNAVCTIDFYTGSVKTKTEQLN